MSVSGAGASVSAPLVPGDFATQWTNLVRITNQLVKMQNLIGSVVVTNPNGSGDGSVPIAPTPPDGSSAGLDPVTGQPLPGTPPIILQQGVYPVADLTILPGAYLTDVYADVTWEVAPASNAVLFEVIWGEIIAAPGLGAPDTGQAGSPVEYPTIVPMNGNEAGFTVEFAGSQLVSGDSYRIDGLLPNTLYGVQIVAMNPLGQSMATPGNGFQVFQTTNDATVPPPVSENGAVIVAAGATSVIVEFQPLTNEQAPDVANGNGVYLVEVTNDPTFSTITRQVYTTAWVVAFNDIYPSTILAQQINAFDPVGTNVAFKDLSQVTPGAQFRTLIDDEYILFNAPSGNSAVIAQRNAGTTPLANGPETHVTGAKVTFSTQTTWYARVAPIDQSGNQGTWTNSNGMQAGGVTDSMIVGDLSAAHITFGVMQGDRIEANSMSVAKLKTGSLTSQNITLAGGSFISGNPPTNGLVINSQGLTLYQAGAISLQLNSTNGLPSLTGAKIVGGTISTLNGHVVIQNDTLSVFDGGNNQRLQLGLTASGSYGIEAFSPDGTISSSYLPIVSSFEQGYLSTTSINITQGVGDMTMPVVRAFIGQSSDALITVSCNLTATASTNAYVWLNVDGVYNQNTYIITGGATGGTFTVVFSLAKFLAASGMPPVSPNAIHTFTLGFSSGGDGTDTTDIGNAGIVVQPV